ncbi:MAG: hypothetical protein WC612_00750 [Bdellovibrionales bacterium]|jgi:hypothetical protein
MSSPNTTDTPQNHCTRPQKAEIKNAGYKLVKTKGGVLWPIVNLEDLFVPNPEAAIQKWAETHNIKPAKPKRRSNKAFVQDRRSFCVYECW